MEMYAYLVLLMSKMWQIFQYVMLLFKKCHRINKTYLISRDMASNQLEPNTEESLYEHRIAVCCEQIKIQLPNQTLYGVIKLKINETFYNGNFVTSNVLL